MKRARDFLSWIWFGIKSLVLVLVIAAFGALVKWLAEAFKKQLSKNERN